METNACPLGCSEDDEILFVARDLLHELPGNFSVVRCKCCDLIRTNPRPSQSEMDTYYPEDYGPHTPIQSVDQMSPLRGRMYRLARVLARDLFVPDLPPGRMLEFGCAYGAYMRQMAAKGWDVMGIEPSARAATAAQKDGLNVQALALEQAECEVASLDLIVGWMALEHLHHPIPALRKLWSWAKSTGKLVVSVPNAASLDFTLFKENGFAVQAPTHLYHFTPTTIAKVLEASGWEVDRIIHQRSEVNLMKSIGYALNETQAPRFLSSWFNSYEKRGLPARLALLPVAQVLGWTGHSGRMVVWATKIKAESPS